MEGNPPGSASPPADPPPADPVEGAPPFALNPAIDVPRLAAAFARDGWVQIEDFLAAPSAAALASHLRARADWRLVVNQGDRLFELDREAQAALTPERRAQLELAVHASARHGFQYFYETVRVPDSARERTAAGDPLTGFAAFLAAPATLDLLRRVTGVEDIAFADAQATAYSPGHFLTAHDDDVAGKKRRAAYVMNLTGEWKADWGGLLMFLGADGHVDRAFVPRFNALNLFRVPVPHLVSQVAPFAPYRRYSVTGWLRAMPVPT